MYFCFHFAEQQDGKPAFAVVCTSRELQRRWSEGTSAGFPAHVDGGYKFNLCGWPVTVFGQTNAAGRWGLGALMLSSGLSNALVEMMLKGYTESTERLNRNWTKREIGMSDAQLSYRSGLREGIGCNTTLMCFFHVKKQSKQWLSQHTVGTSKEKADLWQQVSKDLDMIRGARSPADFESRCDAVDAEWRRTRIHDRTRWTDKTGKERDWCQHFAAQWRSATPEWYVGAASVGCGLPGTNNAAEATVRYTRENFGGRLGNVAQCVKFLLDEVEDASSNPWSPSENRQIPMPTWRKAIAFQKLLGTRRVVAVEHENGTYHVCRERKDPRTDDVSQRDVLKEGIARSVLREQLLLEAGKATACTWTQLARLQTFRFFTQDQCTCGAWLGPRLCFHTVAVQLAAGRRAKPQSLDETPLGPQLGHRPPKAPGRGAPAPKHVLLLVHKKKQAGNEFDLVAEVEVPTGSTVGEAVLAVGRCCSLPPISFRLRDLGALCEDPGGGLTAEEWLVGSTRVLEHEDFRLWLQVRLQGG